MILPDGSVIPKPQVTSLVFSQALSPSMIFLEGVITSNEYMTACLCPVNPQVIMNGADRILTHPAALCTPFRCASKTAADVPFPFMPSMRLIDTTCLFNNSLVVKYKKKPIEFNRR